jgi:hypothetical protein
MTLIGDAVAGANFRHSTPLATAGRIEAETLLERAKP